MVLDDENKRYEYLELQSEIDDLKNQNQRLKHENKQLSNFISNFKSSKSYKLWKKFLKPTMPFKSDIKNIKDIKVAIIADQFTYDSFKFEFNAISLTPTNWKEQFENEKPDLFFCESAWDGHDFDGMYGPWYEKIFQDYRKNEENRLILFEILQYCKNNNIPTIFWNKEDPTSYKNSIRSFADTASRFDYIFTTSKESIKRYKKDFKHPHVYPLMFAAQPRIFNPLKLSNELKNGVVFAGSYYKQFLERSKLMEDIFDKIISKNYELVIYDRNHDDETRKYPDKYKKFINPAINYGETPDIYKSFKWCLNFNTITNSSTMFARRIFELALSYTNILTNYSKGVSEIFKDNVFFFDKSEFPDLNKNYNEKKLNNLYNVLENHTYEKRWMEILDTIGFEYSADKNDITIIYKIDDLSQLESVLDNFNQINYPHKTLKILFSSNLNVDGYYGDFYFDLNEIKINTEFFIIADDLIDENFIKHAILHYQYLNKNIAVCEGVDKFTLGVEDNIRNKVINCQMSNNIADIDEIKVYYI